MQAPVVRRQAMKFGNHGFAAAALAASLVLGILFGQNATVSTLAEAFVSNDAGSSSPQVALSDDGDVWTEGDML